MLSVGQCNHALNFCCLEYRRQKFTLWKHALPPFFSHTIYWENWEMYFLVTMMTFRSWPRFNRGSRLVLTPAYQSCSHSFPDSLVLFLVWRLGKLGANILLGCEGMWSSFYGETLMISASFSTFDACKLQVVILKMQQESHLRSVVEPAWTKYSL